MSWHLALMEVTVELEAEVGDLLGVWEEEEGGN